MKKNVAFYSIIFLMTVGLFVFPVSAQMTEGQTTEEAISPSTDYTLTEEYQEGYRQGFDAGFAQGREAADEVRGFRSPEIISPESSSDDVREYEGAEPETRDRPSTTGGRWNVPGVDSKVDRSGPGF